MSLTRVVLYLGLVPLLLYRLLWFWHLRLNPKPTFWPLQWQLLNFHRQLEGGDSIHPYCSPWYSWPLLLRPLAYWYENLTEPQPEIYRGALASSWPAIFDIHGLGNVALWWLAIPALLISFGVTLAGLYSFCRTQWSNPQLRPEPQQQRLSPISRLDQGVCLYILGNYVVNWLPWLAVNRCLFIYHYMPAALFSFLAVAWLLHNSLNSALQLNRLLGMIGLLMVLGSFFYWLPITLGLPLSPAAFQNRMWLRSWY